MAVCILTIFSLTNPPQKLKGLVLNCLTPILYSRKNAFDQKFFNQLTESRQRNSFLRKVSKTLMRLTFLGSAALMALQFIRLEEAMGSKSDELSLATLQGKTLNNVYPFTIY